MIDRGVFKTRFRSGELSLPFFWRSDEFRCRTRVSRVPAVLAVMLLAVCSLLICLDFKFYGVMMMVGEHILLYYNQVLHHVHRGL